MQFFTFADFETPVSNGGYYDRVLYRDWYSVDVAKNASEAASCRGEHARERVTNTPRMDPGVEIRSAGSAQSKTSDLQTRLLGPKRLCFVNEATSEEAYADYRPLEVSEWQRRHPEAGYPSFLFVSYTSHQFPTQGKATLDSDFGVKYTPAEREDRLLEMSKNRRALTKLAADIVRRSDLDAFWIDFESGIDHTGSVDGDDPGAYAICDILRASKSMIIVVGPTYHFTGIGSGPPNRVEVKYGEWLESWGERLWTLPELLFCPNSDGVPVHTLDSQPPAILSKHSIARTLKDGECVRELIEHYSGTIQLTPLELTVTATQCLFARPHNQFSPGDASYALMGLMRRRPKVNKHDSAFKAFARLSFLNDNHRLLERLICLQPDLSKRQSWSSLYDAYQASLWDIEPCTQVAGIVNAQPARDPNRRPQEDKLAAALDETQIIVLDGAFGAAIKWECLQPVAFMKRASFLQVLARFLVRGFSVWFFYGFILTIAAGAMNSYSEGTGSVMLAAGLPIFIPALIAWPFLPTMVRRLYAGKLWATQAAFFGVNGIPELSEVERCIFGFNQDRLTWSTHGSTLSDAKIDDRTGELLPQKSIVDRDSKAAGLKVFTLVDTFTMTATAFQAERLPVAAVICGQEGGMQRALLCSYDPISRAFCKETVLRMKTTCLERMPRMDRFRFAMRRE